MPFVIRIEANINIEAVRASLYYFETKASKLLVDDVAQTQTPN
jgi:hypothetical protein